MNIIEQMLQDQKNGKRIKLDNYYTNKLKFYDDFEIYKSMHQTNKDLQRELDILYRTIKEKNDNYIFYLDKEFLNNEGNYKEIIQKLLIIYQKDKQSAYDLACKYKKSQREFNKVISLFKKNYINADIYMDSLLDISNYIYTHTNHYQSKKAIKNDYKHDLLNKIYESKLSILDYSFFYDLGSEFDKFTIYSFKKMNNPKAKEVLARKDKTENQIINILDKITNNEINVLEYYEITKLNPILLTQQAVKHKKLNQNYRLFACKLTNSESTTLKKELKAYQVISNIEITDEIKIDAFNKLDEIGAPKTISTYNIMVRRLIKK